MNHDNLFKEADRRYPGWWQTALDMRRKRGTVLPTWPDWCYIPVAGSYAIVSQGKNLGANPKVVDVARLAALIAWKGGKKLVKVDHATFDSVVQIGIGPMHADSLIAHFPRYCVYIQLPDVEVGKSINGFFAHLEHDANDGRRELRLLFDIDGTWNALTPTVIHLTGSLKSGIEAAHAECVKQAHLHGVEVLSPMATTPDQFAGWVALVLHVCGDT